MMAWLDRRMSLALLLGTMLLIGGVTWTTTVPPLDAGKRIDLAEGDYRALISLTKGADKPLIHAPDGRPLLDVSASESVVRVNGSVRTLYEDEYGAASQGNVAHLVWSNADYSILQRIEATAAGVTIDWSWMSRHDGMTGRVEVDLAQFAYYMRNVTHANDRLTYRLDAADPRAAQLLPPSDLRDHEVTVSFDRALDDLWFGQSGQRLDSYHAVVRFDVPPAAQIVPFLRQHVQGDRPDEPGPPTDLAHIRAAPQTREGVIELQAGEALARLGLRKESEKPLLLTQDGRHLLDLSAWESTLRVNGLERPLARHDFTVDSNRTHATLSWLAPGYALEQRISVRSDGLDLEWSWLRAPTAPAQRVELDLAHFAFYMQNASTNERSVSYELDPVDPLTGGGTPGAQRVAVRADLEPAPARLWLAGTPNGTDAYHAVVVLDGPPANESQVFLRERVTFHRGPADKLPEGMPAEVAVPRYDSGRNAYLLEAGGYAASIAMGKGADKPLLRAPEGRALLEFSGWESFVRMDGRVESLYRHEYRVHPRAEGACIVWDHLEYAVRECVNVTSEGMDVGWEWLRKPGAPAQKAELELAHFAYLLEDAGRNGTLVEYFLAEQDPRSEASSGPRYHVLMRLDEPPLRSTFDADAFRLVFQVDGPPEGEWIRVVHQSVTFEREPAE